MVDNSDYGHAHYTVLHRLLPVTLFDDGLQEFIELCQSGKQGEYIFGLWSEFMEVVRTEGGMKRASGVPKVSARSFPLVVDAVIGNGRLVVIGAPAPRMTPQARFIACWFNSGNAQETLRYFAAELPMDEELYGDVLGEWTSEGAHRNFGTFSDPGASTAQLFASAVVRLCTNGAATPDGVTAVPRSGAKTKQGPGDVNFERAEIKKRIARRVSTKDDNRLPVTEVGPVTWESRSARIASEIIGRLRSAQSAGQSVLVVSAERASGLQSAVSTYLQFKIQNKKKLLTEVQGDYSYWGVSVQSRDWTKFTVLGFASPSSSNGNFSIVYQDFRDDRKLHDWLTHTVSAMQGVLVPEGEIIYKGF